ncbi:MAG: STM4013/SEN3800 family hydrolase [Myxococcota bacterium]
MRNAKELLGTHDFVMITLDTLRFDVAQGCYERRELPSLASHLPRSGWERRHSPANFTYAAHHAFFAGFLPTPESPGPHPRLFALAFQGSETTVERTLVFDASSLPEGFRAAGYHTACIGGVGFFNLETPLGRVLPNLFEEKHWRPDFGVTNPISTELQIRCATRILAEQANRVFLFLNVSALHQPNKMYVPGAVEDSPTTQAAALRYVDSQLPPLFDALKRRGKALILVFGDHGTAYGEDGYVGHRLNHPVVGDVPYAEFDLN